jgi:hypothetical protein
VAGRLLRSGVRFSVSEMPLNDGAVKLSRGTLVVVRQRNASNVESLLSDALAGTSVRVRAVDDVWSEGPALGSNRIVSVRDPQIAIVGGPGVDPNSFGMLWHTLDVETETPHTVIALERLGSADLNQFRVVVLPDGEPNLLNVLGKSGVDTLRSWIKGGGTLVAIGGGGAAVRVKELDLSSVKEWSEPKKDGDESAPDKRNDSGVPGAAFATTMNERSYLTLGVPSAPAVLIEGTIALTALPRKADNIVTITESDPLISGFAFPASIDKLKGSPYLTREKVGNGSVITFAGQPNYRLFWRATLPLFMNAVLYSPSFNDRD